MGAHDRLDSSMFWTGALLAFMPVILGLVVAAIVVRNRRRAMTEPGHGPAR